jgi:tRNA(Ile)-lysidine synthase
LLAQLAEIDAVTALCQGRLSIPALSALPEARVRNLLRHILKNEGVPMPDSARLHEAVRQILDAAPDRQVTIDLGEKVLQRYKGEVWIRTRNIRPEPVEWHGEAILAWGGASVRLARVTGGGLAESKLAGKRVMIKPRQGGESFRPDAKRPRRHLKNLLQEHGVPPWEREVMPLLWCEDNLVWVPGIGIDCAWQCPSGTAGLLPEWLPG